MRLPIRSVVLILLCCTAGGTVHCSDIHREASASRSPTIAQLVERVSVKGIKLAPGGARVAYLTARPNVYGDNYEVSLYAARTDLLAKPILITRFEISSDALCVLNYCVVKEGAAEFAWAPDGTSLLFTQRVGGMARLVLWNASTGKTAVLTPLHAQIVLASGEHDQVRVSISDTAMRPNRGLPVDTALLIRDGYRFYGPLESPGNGPAFLEHRYIWHWQSKALESQGASEIRDAVTPPKDYEADVFEPPEQDLEWHTDYPSPDGRVVARVGSAILGDTTPYSASLKRQVEIRTSPEAASPSAISEAGPLCRQTALGWDQTGQRFFFVEQCHKGSWVKVLGLRGDIQTLASDRSELRVPDTMDNQVFDRNGRFAILVKSTHSRPDEIVKVNFTDGTVTNVSSLNADLTAGEMAGAIEIKVAPPLFAANLYLPRNPVISKVPLAVILYESGPGFEQSSGDEVPLDSLIASGIAVVTINAFDVPERNLGGAEWWVARVERPRTAIEGMIRDLAAQYGIDPENVGLFGHSYGSEIAMYMYWRSSTLKAVSSSTGSWSPASVPFGGLFYTKSMAAHGMNDNVEPLDPIWGRLSAALHAAPDLPPLLWQSPDSERNAFVESWYRLRKAGAAVEWLNYPDQGHVKRSPADKWWVYSRNLDWFRFWLQDYEDSDPKKRLQYGRWEVLRKQHEASKAQIKSHAQ